jgi:hypothetical protein
MSDKRPASVALALFLWVVVLAGLAFGVVSTLTQVAALVGG